MLFRSLASTDPSGSVSTGDLIRVYDTILPENEGVFVVTSANTTSITVSDPISNSNIVGDVSVDTLKYNSVGWTNTLNDNVVRYVSQGASTFDKFDSMQIKIVLLAEDSSIVPEVDQIQVIGVSA